MRRPKVWISLFIIMVIGLHAVPLISYQGNRQTRWPILAWHMFANPVPPGPIEMREQRIYGSTAGARRELISPYLVGVNPTALTRDYHRPMARGDTAVAQQLLRRLNYQRADPFVELRIEGEKYTLVGDSVVKEELPPVTYRANPAEPQ